MKCIYSSVWTRSHFNFLKTSNKFNPQFYYNLKYSGSLLKCLITSTWMTVRTPWFYYFTTCVPITSQNKTALQERTERWFRRESCSSSHLLWVPQCYEIIWSLKSVLCIKGTRPCPWCSVRRTYRALWNSRGQISWSWWPVVGQACLLGGRGLVLGIVSLVSHCVSV